MKKILLLITIVCVLFSAFGCTRKDSGYEKAKKAIVKELPFPDSYKMEYTKKGKVPHITSSGFIAVNSDVVYKIKFKTKDKDGTLVHCYAYVMLDNKGNIVEKRVLPIEIPFIDELIFTKAK